MKDKLQLLIDSEENLTRSAFAEMLGIQPATISHIMAGRNKPSYELLQKILQRFTNLRADWLLLDREPMLHDPSLTPSGMPRRAAAPLTDPNGSSAANPAASPASGLPTAMPAMSGTHGAAQPSPSSGDLFGSLSGPSVPPASSGRFAPPQGQTLRESNISDSAELSSVLSQSRAASQVERVVVFYADKTFDVYTPKH